MPRRASPADGAGVGAVLRKYRRGKREQSDCGPEHHGIILRPVRGIGVW